LTREVPTANSPVCGGLITAEKLFIPNMPRFEMLCKGGDDTEKKGKKEKGGGLEYQYKYERKLSASASNLSKWVSTRGRGSMSEEKGKV